MANPTSKDPYKILGVERDADPDTIKRRYRKLARELHPDVNPDDPSAEDRFKRVSQAYSVLSDVEKRKAFDEFGEVALDSNFDVEQARRAQAAYGGRRGFNFEDGGGGGGGGFDFGSIEDLFGGMFEQSGPRRRGGKPRAGRNLEAELTLDLEDAARGGEKRLSITRPTATGGARSETVVVRIPAGMTDGGRIRLPSKGAESRSGGPPGDLFATIHIRPHPVFRLEGRDLHLDVPISIGEATLGAKIEVPTLEGRATVSIPAGTDSGRRLRLRGKGFPDPKGGQTGDLYVAIQIRVPQNLDDEAAAKLEEVSKLTPSDLRKELFE